MNMSRRRMLIATAATTRLFSAKIPRVFGATLIEPTTVAEHLMYCTARVVGAVPNSKDVKTGTGFFFSFPAEDKIVVPVLITNKHVIEGTAGLEFLIHTATVTDAKRPDANAVIKSVAEDWVLHPNPKVDLCALPLGPFINAMKDTSPFYRALDPTIIKSDVELEEMNAVEDVSMIGYPNGLWDSVNNYPLLRRGITASHPAIDFDVDGVPTTVVDVAAFPGSSGSPVFIYNNGTITDKKGVTSLGSRAILLGVLFSGPTYQSDGTIIIKSIPTGNVPVPQISMMMNLGYIVKAKEVLELGKVLFTKYNVVPKSSSPPAIVPKE